MKCLNCGSEVPDQSAFCFNCGSKMSEQQTSESEAEATAEAENPEEEPVDAESQPNAEAAREADVPEAPQAPEPPAAPDMPESPEQAAAFAQPPDSSNSEVPDEPIIPSEPEPEATPEPAAAPEPASVFCPQCGKQAKPDTVFCTNCGRNLKKPASSAAAAPAAAFAAGAWAQPVPPAAGQQYGQPPAQPPYGTPNRPSYNGSGYSQQQGYQQPYQQQPGYQQPYYQQAGQYTAAAPYGSPPAKKKSKKGLVVFLIILAVIIAAGALTAVFAGRDVMRMIRGPKKSYISAETKQLKEYTTDLVSAMIKENAGDTEKGGRIVDLNLDLNASAMGMDPSLQTTLQNIVIRNTFMYDDNSESRIYNKLDFVVGDEDVLTLEALKDDDQMMLGVPQIIGSYLMADEQEMEEMMGSGTGVELGNISVIGQLITTGLEMNQKDVEKSMNKLVDIALKYIDDAEFEKNVELEIGSWTAGYDRYTVTTSGENVRDMMVEILETLRDDEIFYELYTEFSSLAADPEMDEMPDYDEWMEQIDAMLAEVENDDIDLENVQIQQMVYVDRKDNIRGRHLILTNEYDEEVINLQYYDEIEADDEFITALIIENEGEKTEMIAAYTKEGEKKTGSLAISAAGQAIMEADFADFASFEMKDETWYTGSASISMGEAAGSGMPGIEWEGSYDDDRYQMSIGLGEFGTVTVGYQIIDSKQVNIPALTDVETVRITDEEGLQSLMTEDVMTNLQNVMSSLGISEDVLAGLMMGGNGDYEDYEDYEEYEDYEDWEDQG